MSVNDKHRSEILSRAERDAAFEEANEREIKRIRGGRLGKSGIQFQQSLAEFKEHYGTEDVNNHATDPSAGEWRAGSVDSLMDRRRVYDSDRRVVATANSDDDAAQIVADHAAVSRLTAAATRTTERLSDLPRYLESNGMGTLASIVEDCLTELSDAAEKKR